MTVDTALLLKHSQGMLALNLDAVHDRIRPHQAPLGTTTGRCL